MKRVVPAATVSLAFALALGWASGARADPPSNPYSASSPPGAPVVLPAAPPPAAAASAPALRSLTVEESLVSRARELLNRARFLDEAAVADEKTATELVARLPTLRTAAKSARERADKAKDSEKEPLVARAEDLEAELAVSEAELAMKRRSAAEDRRVARDLRVRAVRLVRDAPSEENTFATNACDPPFRFTPDGRKIYRVECLK